MRERSLCLRINSRPKARAITRIPTPTPIAALTPVEIINKHTHFGTSNPNTPRTPTNPSSFFTESRGATGSVSQPDHVSTVSSSQPGGYGAPTGLHAPPSPHQNHGALPRGSLDQHRPDSPALGQSVHQGSPRLPTPTMPAPIRTNTGGFSITSPGGAGGPGTPLISPPSPGLGRDAPDYISVHSSLEGSQSRGLQGSSSGSNNNSNRRSMFHENPDDLEMR